MQHQVLSTQSSQQEKELEQDEDREIDRKSLNNLMRSEQESNGEANVSNKNSLGQHFGDDEAIKQTMQVVVKKQGGENGVKFKGMMSRYVKVLSGLMKAKRDRKTSALRFKTWFEYIYTYVRVPYTYI